MGDAARTRRARRRAWRAVVPEQQIGQDDQPIGSHARDPVERGLDARLSDAEEGRLDVHQAAALADEARDFAEVAVGVGVAGASADDEEQRLAARLGVVRNEGRRRCHASSIRLA